MSRLNVDRMWRHAHRADVARWDSELRAAGADPWVARDIYRDFRSQVTLGQLPDVMEWAIADAHDRGIYNGPLPREVPS